jgi:hypothetical protein
MTNRACLLAMVALSGCNAVQLVQPREPHAMVASVLILERSNLDHRGEKFQAGCLEGVRDSHVAMVEEQYRHFSGRAIYEQMVAATGVQAILTTEHTGPPDDDLVVGPSEVWLMDNHGHVLASALFSAQTSRGDAFGIGRQLCRAVLAGTTK